VPRNQHEAHAQQLAAAREEEELHRRLADNPMDIEAQVRVRVSWKKKKKG
jgi:hypothetical protein